MNAWYYIWPEKTPTKTDKNEKWMNEMQDEMLLDSVNVGESQPAY